MALTPLINRQRMVIAAALLVAAIAVPVAARVVSAGAFATETESARQARAMEYLSEIGFGVEYGSTAPVLHKWTQDVRLKVHGSPTEADLHTLRLVVSELNSLVEEINLELVDEEANLEVHFSPESHFSSIEPTYVPVNLGYFRVWFDGDGAIQQGRVLIASDGITQAERSHLIREELTQSLGLFMDSWEYPDSIFYEGWTTTDQYGPLDKASIRLLYQPQLGPGMNRSQLEGLYLPTD